MKANTYVVKPFGISEVKVIALKGDPGTPTQEQVNTAVDEYMTEHPEAQIPDGSITEQKLSSDVVATLNDVDNKADKVGSYPDIIAGTADNLLSSSYQTDRTPYILRRTPYGAREKGSIVGGSVVWNQLVSAVRASSTVNGLTFTNNYPALSITGTCTVSTNYTIATVSLIDTHVYACFLGAVRTNEYSLIMGNARPPVGNDGVVVRKNASFASSLNVQVAAGATIDITIKPTTFDLTLMFGSTIADYIYTQEQAAAGAGVALAKVWAGITADYYPYDAGSIKSVTGLTAHKMTDGNGDIIGEYPLDSSLTLRGLLKLDGDNLYYDGDIYKASGEVERRYAVRAYQSGDESDANVLTDGTNTVYKLATPTTEQAEPYTALQICDPAGTEEFVGASMPVGHETKYYADLKGKIEDLPDAPSTNGTYVLKATVSSSGVTYEWIAG